MTGWATDAPALGSSMLELLAFLVLHTGERFTTEQLRNQMAAGRERDLQPDTIRRYLGDLRRALGDERVPEARAGRGYEVKGVGSDVARFNAELALASANETAAEKAAHLANALSLVRAAPFAEVPEGTCGWAESRIAPALANSILDTAVELGELAIAAADPELADAAAERGLLVWPTDESLHRVALRAAALTKPSRLNQAWAKVNSILALHAEMPSAGLIEHYRRLKERSS